MWEMTKSVLLKLVGIPTIVIGAAIMGAGLIVTVPFATVELYADRYWFTRPIAWVAKPFRFLGQSLLFVGGVLVAVGGMALGGPIGEWIRKQFAAAEGACNA
jgi:hypothetical protein